jgi:hypothetical protein
MCAINMPLSMTLNVLLGTEKNEISAEVGRGMLEKWVTLCAGKYYLRHCDERLYGSAILCQPAQNLLGND